MSSNSLEHKTVRPGSFTNYNYYHSDEVRFDNSKKTEKKRRSHKAIILLVVVLVAVGYFGVFKSNASPTVARKTVSQVTAPKVVTKSKVTPPVQKQAAAAAPVSVNHCASNTLNQLILVSVSARHLWACQGSQTVYDSPVVTGIEYLAADLTPVGTYHIYGKYTDTTLTGHDSTGSWNDYVYYWQPFLHNQYGSYGLHDATWRDPSAFGNIDPNSSDASHGCVELPLATSKWLYNWDSVGTTVTIES